MGFVCRHIEWVERRIHVALRATHRYETKEREPGHGNTVAKWTFYIFRKLFHPVSGESNARMQGGQIEKLPWKDPEYSERHLVTSDTVAPSLKPIKRKGKQLMNERYVDKQVSDEFKLERSSSIMATDTKQDLHHYRCW